MVTPQHDHAAAPAVKDYERSLRERVFHGLLFEVLAIGIATPLAAWLTGRGLFAMGVLSAVISFMAIVWNMVFNWAFDQLQKRHGFRRNTWVRMGHALAFEGGLIVMAVPFIAWWIDASLWHAFVIDIGLLLFFLPYTFVFNLVYDRVRVRVLGRARTPCRAGSR